MIDMVHFSQHNQSDNIADLSLSNIFDSYIFSYETVLTKIVIQNHHWIILRFYNIDKN